MSEEIPSEADRVEGAPDPRETRALIGQEAAEAAFLDAFTSGRMHHGWLITGPRGVGKATLAWRIARFLLAQPPEGEIGLFGAPEPPQSLSISVDDPVAHRVAALSEPRLKLLRRPWDDKTKRLKTVISVDEVRGLKGFFHLSAADGGRRVVIVDPADELNIAAANALLKELEEPPEGVVILLISHQPSRLLPTIRSRCRELRLSPLTPEQMERALIAAGAEGTENAAALAELSAGSVGEAVRLVNLGGEALYASLIALLSTAPGLDRPRALALAESVSARGAEAKFDLMLGLMDLLLARMARAGVTGMAPPEASPGETDLMLRLAPNSVAGRAWAEAQQEISLRARQGRSVNLDPAALLLDMILRIDETAGRWSAR